MLSILLFLSRSLTKTLFFYFSNFRDEWIKFLFPLFLSYYVFIVLNSNKESTSALVAVREIELKTSGLRVEHSNFFAIQTYELINI